MIHNFINYFSFSFLVKPLYFFHSFFFFFFFLGGVSILKKKYMKKEHINIFPDEISALSGAYYDSYR